MKYDRKNYKRNRRTNKKYRRNSYATKPGL